MLIKAFGASTCEHTHTTVQRAVSAIQGALAFGTVCEAEGRGAMCEANGGCARQTVNVDVSMCEARV